MNNPKKHLMNFRLPSIDRTKTRQAVENELETLKNVLLTKPLIHQPNITASFQLVPGGGNNQFSSSTEDAAVKNIEEETERNLYIDKMSEVINRLPEEEREVIVSEYMNSNYKYNYEIFDSIGVSKSQFYRLKAKAFYNLAFMLRIQVYRFQGGEDT